MLDKTSPEDKVEVAVSPRFHSKEQRNKTVKVGSRVVADASVESEEESMDIEINLKIWVIGFRSIGREMQREILII